MHYAELALQMQPKDDTKTIITNQQNSKPPAYSAYFDDQTIYAQIDHCNYNKSSSNLLGSSATSLNNGCLKTSSSGIMLDQPSQYVQLISPNAQQQQNQNLILAGNNSNCNNSSAQTSLVSSYHTQTLPLTSNKQYLREVVTVKTPLSFSEQESCV